MNAVFIAVPASRRHRFLAPVLACLLGLAGFAAPLRAMDCYLKLDGIPGEITVGPLTGWSAITGVGAECVAAPPPVDPTLPPAPPALALKVIKPVDALSPELAVRCAGGQHIPRLTVLCRNGRDPYLRITLEDVLITSCLVQGGGGLPVEEASFSFRKIEWKYLLPANPAQGLSALFDLDKLSGLIKVRPPFTAVLQRQPGAPGLVFTCPVEAGHRYRLAISDSPGGPWKTGPEFTATEDGVMQQALSLAEFRLFARLEELE